MQVTIEYPAIFRQEENRITVDVPGIPNCYTCGKDLDEAVKMAADTIEKMLIPDPVIGVDPDLMRGSLDVRHFVAEIQINVREAEDD